MISMNIAIVTGAFSGIGQEFAQQISASHSKDVEEIWLIARRRLAGGISFSWHGSVQDQMVWLPLWRFTKKDRFCRFLRCMERT